jgi:hypothetical protein
VLQRLRARASNRVRRTADLERADRLQVLELEVDLGRRFRDVEANERSAQGRACKQLARAFDLFEGDQN